MTAFDDGALIARYLLQDVTPKEQEAIEQRYFSHPAYLARVDAAEDDLIDAYVRNELPRAQREQFEQNFLCTRARMERLRMAEALHRQLPRRRSWWRVWTWGR